MAVYTHVNADQVKTLLSQYDLGAYQSHEGILSGVENTNYDLRTDQAHAVLTIFEKRVDPSHLPFVFAFMAHLKKEDIPVADIYMNKAGGKISEFLNKSAAISSYLNGQSIRPAGITLDHCKKIGDLLARMHVISKGVQIKLEKEAAPNRYQKLYSFIQKTDQPLPKDFSVRIENIFDDWREILTLDLPQGPTHLDLFPDNVFFDDDECVSGVLDFYFSCTNLYVYDLAITMNAWCFDQDHHLDETKWHALLSAYQSIRPLSDAEKEVFPKIREAAALRFFMTRQYDWINTPANASVTKHDPNEYAIKLEAQCPDM